MLRRSRRRHVRRLVSVAQTSTPGHMRAIAIATAAPPVPTSATRARRLASRAHASETIRSLAWRGVITRPGALSKVRPPNVTSSTQDSCPLQRRVLLLMCGGTPRSLVGEDLNYPPMGEQEHSQEHSHTPERRGQFSGGRRSPWCFALRGTSGTHDADQTAARSRRSLAETVSVTRSSQPSTSFRASSSSSGVARSSSAFTSSHVAPARSIRPT